VSSEGARLVVGLPTAGYSGPIDGTIAAVSAGLAKFFPRQAATIVVGSRNPFNETWTNADVVRVHQPDVFLAPILEIGTQADAAAVRPQSR
jgi:hypothetical protein